MTRAASRLAELRAAAIVATEQRAVIRMERAGTVFHRQAFVIDVSSIATQADTVQTKGRHGGPRILVGIAANVHRDSDRPGTGGENEKERDRTGVTTCHRLS